MSEMLCPLLPPINDYLQNCIGTNCYWWHKTKLRCYIIIIGDELQEIRRNK